MPVYIYDTDAFDKLVAVEGERFRQDGSEYMSMGTSFGAFLRVWNWLSGDAEAMEAMIDSGMNLTTGLLTCLDNPPEYVTKYWLGYSEVIYGLGGFNRYMVLTDGEIRFSAFHGTEEKIELAMSVGFNVY